MNTKYILIIIALSINAMAYAQKDTHPLDKSYKNCLKDNNYTDRSTTECLKMAIKDWDKQLNTVYTELRKSMSDKQKELLKTSQLNWLKYRDNEFLFIEGQVEGMEGSMYVTIVLRNKLRVVKDRVLELEAYLSYYKTMQ